MLKNKDVNMLSGPLFKNIVLFTVPIIITNFLQLVFNTADLIIVGRFCGSVSVAAVGATSSLTHLMINLFIGLSVGAGISAAQAIGARDEDQVKRIVHTAVPVAVISGIIITVVGVLGAEYLLELMETPKEVFSLSVLYLRIYFAGITATMVYNFSAAILRAAGDTRSPLTFLLLSGVFNVILNVVFVTVFDMTVDGVALATVISQILSATLTVRALMKRTDACKLILKEIHIYKEPLIKFIKIGIPAGIQNCTFSISNVIIQSSVNSFGQAAIAGNSAGVNIAGYINAVMIAFQQTTVNFVGQNEGNNNYKRIKKIYAMCLALVFVIEALMGALAFIYRKPLLSLFITDSSEAIAIGTLRIGIVCTTQFLLGLMEVTTGTIRGMGVSLAPMASSMIGVCGFRILWIFTIFRIPDYHSVTSIFVSYPISWFLTFLIELIIFTVIIKYKQEKYKQIKEQVLLDKL
ncbi:MAG: MATE family efflux transporter [Ruminococcaceae bacterium]|nr:MATE family efflux transporter [Oscillospiraceae bacterium]